MRKFGVDFKSNVRSLIMSYKLKKIFVGFSTILLVVLIPILNQTCTESPNSPDNEPFSFKVKVADNSNRPLSNLKIGVYFHFTDPFMNKKLLEEVNTNNGVTVLRYSVNKLSRLTLVAYDLENNVAMEMINNDIHYVGNYEVLFITGELFPGVYKCVIVAKDTLNGNTLFRDSIYAVLWHKDPVYNGIGFTDNNGNFETQNKLYFPSLYKLPSLIRTLEDGPEPVGTFSIEDSVTILVTDTLNNLTSIYTRKIKGGLNNFEMTFPGNEREILVKSNFTKTKKEYSNKFKVKNSDNIFKISSVGLEYFNATPEANDIHLNWKTNWEINNTGFEIQRYYHHSEFYAIGFLQGQGTTNQEFIYSFVDQNLNIGDYMYRLKIIEFDGSFEYSDTLEVSIIFPTEYSLYQNYPNPFN
jgi:hypothetical protein